MFAHFAPDEMATVSPEGRRAFFRDNVGRVGPVLQISRPTGFVSFSYHFPTQSVAWAQLSAEGKSSFGPVRIYFEISDPGDGWRIDKTWSERLYTEKPPDYR